MKNKYRFSEDGRTHLLCKAEYDKSKFSENPDVYFHEGYPFMKNLGFHEFNFFLSDEIRAVSFENELYHISGGDLVWESVMEVRKGEKRLRYKPYELYVRICEGRDFSEVVEDFLQKCREM